MTLTSLSQGLRRDSLPAKVPGPDSYRDCPVAFRRVARHRDKLAPSLSRHNMSGLNARPYCRTVRRHVEHSG